MNANYYFEEIIKFFFCLEVETWKSLFWGSLLFPVTVYLGNYIINYIRRQRPVHKLNHDFISTENEILFFLSQLDLPQENKEYIFCEYPQPKSEQRNNLEKENYSNIDLFWSAADGKCLSYVVNLIGKLKRQNNIKIANLISDWDNIIAPMICIGFNPKTKIILENNQVYFTTDGIFLYPNGFNFKLHCYSPNDWGVIQKTVLQNTKQPVLILAGAGTKGTELAGFIYSKYSVELGRLYGNNNFCLTFNTNKEIDAFYHELKTLYPEPTIIRKIIYFRTFYKYKKLNLFPVGS